MESTHTFEELLDWCRRLQPDLPQIKLNITNVRLKTDERDEVALLWVPKDCPIRNPYPIHTIGDGSCFINAAVRQIFGVPCGRQGNGRLLNFHLAAELKVRLVIEGVINKKRYLDYNYLALGMREESIPTSVTTMYVLMSGVYDDENTLTDFPSLYNRMMFNYSRRNQVSSETNAYRAPLLTQLSTNMFFRRRPGSGCSTCWRV
jgi:hypothetical protein